MFIYNVKVSGSKIFKVFLVIVSICVFILFAAGIYKLVSTAKSETTVKDELVSPDISNITSKNYTNILKSVHDNLPNYIGQKIKFTGYIYRVYDLKENQFVLARNMVISSDFQTLVVGFLCKHDKAQEYKDGTWVEITGEITKGDYHGEIPEIKVNKIKTIEKPTDEYVYPPDDSYVPTSTIM